MLRYSSRSGRVDAAPPLANGRPCGGTMASERANAGQRELGDVIGELVDGRRREVQPRKDPADAGIEPEQELRLDARHTPNHPRIVGTALKQLADEAAEVLDARPNRLLDDQLERRRRFGHLAADELMNPGVPSVRRD